VTLLRKLLVLPLLTPVLMVLVLAAANPRPDLSLRLLTWRSPTLPLGTWLAIGAAGGLSLGAGASALAIAGARPSAASHSALRMGNTGADAPRNGKRTARLTATVPRPCPAAGPANPPPPSRFHSG
jgi:hypothetical protein